MMEKLSEDMNEWERRHQHTWLGRSRMETGPMNWGAGISMQADLMSPLGLVDYSNDPSLFNLMKAGYNPAIAFGGYSLVQWATGTRIGFAERILHSADMTKRTLTFVGRGTFSGLLRVLPPVTAGAVAGGLWMGTQAVLQWLNPDMPAFGDMSGWTA